MFAWKSAHLEKQSQSSYMSLDTKFKLFKGEFQWMFSESLCDIVMHIQLHVWFLINS